MRGRRQEQRVRMRLPVRVWGLDAQGKLFSLKAHTMDITPIGARLQGVTCVQHPGAIIGVEHGRSRARFRVQWVGEPGTAREGQIGIRCMEPGKYIWGVALARVLGDHESRLPGPAAPSGTAAKPHPAAEEVT